MHALALSAQQGQGLRLCVELVITLRPPHEKTANRWKRKTDTPDTVNQSSLPRKQKVELIRWASRSFRARLKGPTSVDYRSALEPVSFLRFSGSKQVEGCWAKHKGAFGTLVSSG